MRNGLIYFIGALSFVAGLFLGLRFHGAPVQVIEASAPAVRQSDGSLILERRPDASAVAPMQIPKSAKLERLAKVTVKPRPLASAASAVDCVPVSLDLALVKMPDDSRRMIASSPDGEVVAGFDIPVLPTISVAQPKWAVGADWPIGTRQVRPRLEYDAGQRIRVGGSVWEQGGKPAGSLTVMWRF